ncbi:hypothetical protein L6452_27955 [Arctium lappa]|uniref:Uncharacterized protein n=2 Tax=Arctium lappa TaxID=4217 RepID=A0ACB8ZWK9_ARCLA|nr:hypothetical protein L6452_27953 [Arctium lappa]KAI3702227.1 hypothetical protein L6452_27955 [Arctium lappa]
MGIGRSWISASLVPLVWEKLAALTLESQESWASESQESWALDYQEMWALESQESHGFWNIRNHVSESRELLALEPLLALEHLEVISKTLCAKRYVPEHILSHH